MSTLTPVMATAGAGLLPNPSGDVGVALIMPTDLSSAIASYNSVTIVSKYQDQVLPLAVASWKGTSAVNTISLTTLQNMFAVGSNTYPAITGAIPGGTAPTSIILNGLYPTWDQYTTYQIGNIVVYENVIYSCNVKNSNHQPNLHETTAPPHGDPLDVTLYWSVYAPAYAFADVALSNSNTIMGNGDLSFFCTVFSAAYGYTQSSSVTINSVKSSDVLATTFDPATGGMNSLTTAGFNQVTGNLQALGADLSQLGEVMSLSTLDNFGLPGELLAQIGRLTGGIPPALGIGLLAAGISDSKIQTLAAGVNQLTQTEEKTAYGVMENVTGNALEQVLFVLKITSSNFTNMAQLLNLKYLLPNSYKTLLAPVTTVNSNINSSGLVPIYQSNGEVNTELIPVVDNVSVTFYSGVNNNNSYRILQFVTPADQALANKAFARSLQQIKSISTSTLPLTAKAMTLLETNDDLPAVKGLLSPVPSSVSTTYATELGQGTGPDGKISLADVIGVISDPLFVNGFSLSAQLIPKLTVTGINEVFTRMINLLTGVYGPFEEPIVQPNIIIPAGPGAGTYANFDDALNNGLIPAANTALTALVASNTDISTELNTFWTNMKNSLSRQTVNQSKAQINFYYLKLGGTNSSSTMGLANNLHVYGTDVSVGGASELLTKLANKATLSGQCIIASLREGRNIQALQPANIQLDTQLSNL